MRTLGKFRRLLIIGAAVAAPAVLVTGPATADVGAERPSAQEQSHAGAVAAANAVCAQAHMQDRGWLPVTCADAGNSVTVGLPGEGLRMEALSLSVSGSNFCLIGYVQGTGWEEEWSCGADGETVQVGATGQGLRLEAVAFGVEKGTICGRAYTPGNGWKAFYCGVDGQTNAAGTTGQDLRIEALEFMIR